MVVVALARHCSRQSMAALISSSFLIFAVAMTMLVLTSLLAHAITQSCLPPGKVFSNKCFRLHEQLVTFSDAIDVCRADGSFLAQIHTKEEDEFITQNIVPEPLEEEGDGEEGGSRPSPASEGDKVLRKSPIWLGGIRVHPYHNDASFRWLNGDRFNYSRWFPGVGSRRHLREPNNDGGIQDCVAIGVNGRFGGRDKWFDMECDLLFRPLCEKSIDGSDLHLGSRPASITYELHNLDQEIDRLTREHHLFASKRWIMIVVIILLTVICVLMFLIGDFSSVSLTCSYQWFRKRANVDENQHVITCH